MFYNLSAPPRLKLVNVRIPLSQELLVLPSTWKEPVRFREAGAVFSFSADTPCHGSNAKDHSEHDGGISFPIGWLRIPTTSRRPDMFGISAEANEFLGGEWRMKRGGG